MGEEKEKEEWEIEVEVEGWEVMKVVEEEEGGDIYFYL